MIKIIIKEQATRAGTAAAGTQAIKSYYNPNQTKTKDKTKEATPVTDTELAQPQQEPEQTKPTVPQIVSVPPGWKPDKGTKINLKNKNGQQIAYRVSNKGNWVGPDSNPVKKDLIPTLNLEAYKLQQSKQTSTSTTPPTQPSATSPTTQTTATPVSIGPEDAPTEEVSTPVTGQEVSEEIDYPKLFSKVSAYSDFREQDNVIGFVDKTVQFLQSNDSFKSIYQQIEKQIQELSLSNFKDQRKQQRIKNLTNTLVGAADDLSGMITEVMDPITGLSILLGTISLGTLIGGLNYKRLRAKSNETPEGRYLFLLGLEIKLLITKSIIDGNPVTDIQNLITNKMKPDLEQFKKPSLNLFKQKNLLKEKTGQLDNLASKVFNLIRQKSDVQRPSVQLDESTINRWKTLAGIRG